MLREADAAGEVDIVIGTHRLLSPDVEFHELGLLVVDEEQRFGVKHKERLKQLRSSRWTSSPSPPRPSPARCTSRCWACATCRSSRRRRATGSRSSPTCCPGPTPSSRTRIRRELDRGGQVFFVHNRVETIYTVAERVERLVPEARDRGGARADEGARAGGGHAPLRRAARWTSWWHLHHRVGAGRAQRQHADRGPRRPVRALAALPDPRPGGPLAPPRLLLPPHPRERLRGRREAPAGAGALHGAGERLRHRPQGPGAARRG